jgi:hypothetical protein
VKPFAVQHFNFERAEFGRFATDPVTIRGKAAVTVWRSGQERTAASVNGFADVPGLRHCYTSRMESHHREELLKVTCETPGDIPLLTNIRLHDPSNRQEWRYRLGDSYTDVRYPAESWLSALTRSTFLPALGDRGTVPEEWVNRSQFTLSSFQVALQTGRLEITGVQLTRHIAKTR